MAAELFELVRAGKIVSEPRQTFALKDAADAHRALESRGDDGRDGPAALAVRAWVRAGVAVALAGIEE